MIRSTVVLNVFDCQIHAEELNYLDVVFMTDGTFMMMSLSRPTILKSCHMNQALLALTFAYEVWITTGRMRYYI